MARAHGRFGNLYVAVASGGSASPLQHAGTWTLDLSTDQVEVTAFGDTSKTYVAGLPDGRLSYSGYASDTASTALITAAVDGVARKFYAYPFNTSATYFFGTMFFDTSWDVRVDGAVAISGNGSPATPVASQGF